MPTRANVLSTEVPTLRSALTWLHGQVVTLRAERRIDTAGSNERTNMLTVALLNAQKALDGNSPLDRDARLARMTEVLRALVAECETNADFASNCEGSEHEALEAAKAELAIADDPANAFSVSSPKGEPKAVGEPAAKVEKEDPDCGLTKDEAAKIRSLAIDQCQQDGHVEIDANAAISYSPDQAEQGGTYVAAWVWVEFKHSEVITSDDAKTAGEPA